MNRLKTGVNGLDRLLGGGIPERSAVLLTGESGTGKTLAGLQFLYEGAIKDDHPGLLIQVGKQAEELFWYEKMLGYDLGRLQDQEKLVIYSFKPKDYSKFNPSNIQGEFISKIKNIIEENKIKRVVIDAISPLGHLFTPGEYQRSLFEFVEVIKNEGATCLILSSPNPGAQVEEIICDGVIKIRKKEEEEGFSRQLLISKMVATNFPMAWYPVSINDRGFSVRPFL